MNQHRKLNLLWVVIGVTALFLVGCATPPQASSTDYAAVNEVEEIAEAVDCGTFGIIESVPGGGAPTRQAALEDMVRGHQSLIGTAEAKLLRSTPEDTLLTLQAALRALPEVEMRVGKKDTVTVPAVAEDGTNLGEFVIIANGDNYVISSYIVAHEGGTRCAPAK